MRKLIYLFIVAIISSCSNKKNKIPENFDYGKTENGFYKNEYFNMEVVFNPNWVVQDKKTDEYSY